MWDILGSGARDSSAHSRFRGVADTLGNGAEGETVLLACFLGKCEEKEEDERAQDWRPTGNLQTEDRLRIKAPKDRRKLGDTMEAPMHISPSVVGNKVLHIADQEICGEGNGADGFGSSEKHETHVTIVAHICVLGQKLLEHRAPLYEMIDGSRCKGNKGQSLAETSGLLVDVLQ
jgi:hypothetical protein